jgi:hypothetical protein
MVYKPRPGHRLRTSAENVGRRIDELAEANKDLQGNPCVTPEMVVADARTEDSPLRPEFADLESVDECVRVAWHQRALNLIGSYIRVYIEDDNTEREVLGNIRVVQEVEQPDGSTTRERVYVSPEVAMKRPDLREQVLADAQRYLAGAQERLRLIDEAGRLVNDIERIKKRLEKMTRRKPTLTV